MLENLFHARASELLAYAFRNVAPIHSSMEIVEMSTFNYALICPHEISPFSPLGDAA